MSHDLHLKEYQANSVGTADQKQLIVMLYEGARNLAECMPGRARMPLRDP